MAGVQLRPEQVRSLVDAMASLFDMAAPLEIIETEDRKSVAIPQAILTAKTCLACHSLESGGAPGGGIGGALEKSASRDEDTLRSWLANPTAENAIQLKIREAPMGAMAAFKLTDAELDIVVPWLLSLKSE